MTDDPKPKPQIDKFKEAARAVETDDDPERFKERVGALVRRKPAAKSNTKPKRKSHDQTER